MKKTYQAGLRAEGFVKSFYQRKGYKIIAHRYKCRFGEIDLIAVKNSSNIFGKFFSRRKSCYTIYFIEVKYRKNNELIESVLRSSQISRIKDAAAIFLSKHEEYLNCNISFDFATVDKYSNVKIYQDFF